MAKTRTLYRSRNGKVFGVFQGIADATGLDAFWMRFIFVIFLLLTGIFPLIPLYILAALLMRPRPLAELNDEEEEFYNSMTTNRTLAVRRLSSKLDALDRRARRIEDIAKARGYDWDQRMKENS